MPRRCSIPSKDNSVRKRSPTMTGGKGTCGFGDIFLTLDLSMRTQMHMSIVRKATLAVFATALFLTPAVAFAQNGVGVKGGVNLATFKISPDQPDNVGKLQGLTFGIYVPSPAK